MIYKEVIKGLIYTTTPFVQALVPGVASRTLDPLGLAMDVYINDSESPTIQSSPLGMAVSMMVYSCTSICFSLVSPSNSSVAISSIDTYLLVLGEILVVVGDYISSSVSKNEVKFVGFK